MIKLSKLLYEAVDNDLIEIIGYHRSNNENLSLSNISMDPRETRQSGTANKKYVGFYITMPKIKVESLEDLPSKIEGSSKGGENYGKYLYKVTLKVPRREILLNNAMVGSTRISSEDLGDKYLGKKFIYVPRGFPTAEGIVLDTSIIQSVEKVEI